jgi:thioredoxin
MSGNDFFERVKQNPRPVVVDFWAPWCVPCRSITPVLKQLGDQYEGRVDVWKVNSDEHPDLLRKLNIFGIPTLIAFNNGEEISRRTGAANASVLSSLFETALSGEKQTRRELAPSDRMLRLVGGLIILLLAVLGHFSGWYLVLAGLGGVLLFSAIYDRCPIYQAVSARLRSLIQRNSTTH